MHSIHSRRWRGRVGCPHRHAVVRTSRRWPLRRHRRAARGAARRLAASQDARTPSTHRLAYRGRARPAATALGRRCRSFTSTLSVRMPSNSKNKRPPASGDGHESKAPFKTRRSAPHVMSNAVMTGITNNASWSCSSTMAHRNWPSGRRPMMTNLRAVPRTRRDDGVRTPRRGPDVRPEVLPVTELGHHTTEQTHRK